MTEEHVVVWIAVTILYGSLFYLHVKDRLPSINSVRELAEVVNTKGGIILLLGFLSLIFFFSTVRFVYWILDHEIEGKIPVSDAFALAGFAFMSGNAFGGSWSAMLKTMTGDSAATPATKEPVTNSEQKPGS